MEITHRVARKHREAVHSALAELKAAVAGAADLGLMDTGPSVKNLQRMLRGLGLYSGDINGTFDAATEASVKKLEAQTTGATADGRFDAAELAEVRSRQLFVKDGFETPARIGQKGRDIYRLESTLKNLGYHTGELDGVYDAQLEKAVDAFRKDAKGVPDEGNGAGSLVWKGASGEVRDLERDLKKLGRKPGKVDGRFTDKTAAAVRAFQRKHDLAPTGIANGRTRDAIARAANAGLSDKTKKFIQVAKAQIGDPYVFGAQGPDAFDCSGLIHYALKKAGVNDTRTTADGYMDRYQGSRVSRENLKPGDLVFFWYPNDRGIGRGNASHIEIYLGNGKTMGTDNPSEGARVEDIDWSAFIGGARVPGLNK